MLSRDPEYLAYLAHEAHSLMRQAAQTPCAEDAALYREAGDVHLHYLSLHLIDYPYTCAH